jgi:UDP-glucose 4-epimerase
VGLRPCHDLAAAHVLALQSLRDGSASTKYNLGNGTTSVKDVIESVERVVGRKAPHTMAPRRPGDPAVLYASSARIRKDLGRTPRLEDVDVTIETAWRWRESHPNGYGKAKA